MVNQFHHEVKQVLLNEAMVFELLKQYQFRH